ncbi:hypothetical protein ACE6H2_026028 [Prunus campanulata]
MSIDRYFETHVWQREKPYINQSHLPPDFLAIRFKFYKSTIRAWCPREEDHDVPIVVPYSPRNLVFVTQETIKVHRTMLKFSSTTSLMVDILSIICLSPRMSSQLLSKTYFVCLSKNIHRTRRTPCSPLLLAWCTPSGSSTYHNSYFWGGSCKHGR